MIFATKAIGKAIADAVSAADPSLKLCTFGGLEKLPAPEDFSTQLPAVIVKPVRREVTGQTAGRVKVRYTYDVIRVREFQPGEEVESVKADGTDALDEGLLRAVPALPAGILFDGSDLPQTDFENEVEDGLAALGFASLSATKTRVVVETEAAK